MKFLWHPASMEHDTGAHPESADRLSCLGPLEITEVEADENVLSLVHSKDYIERVRNYSANSRVLDNDTLLSPGSFKAAVYGANMAIKASAGNDFALMRPPGHHAYEDHGSGFCLFNNVAIAAKNLSNQGKKVLIFDFDGHQGDGTAAIFGHDPNVFYCSLHQLPGFPSKGYEHEIGIKEGLGFTMNLSLPPQAGDDILEDALKIMFPVMKQFNPDIVAVSAGFDAHQMDPLLQLRWTDSAYHLLGKTISKNFNNIFAVLEGGYNTDVLPQCIDAFKRGIEGKKFKSRERHTDSEILVWNEYEIRANNLINHLRPYWTI